jgi:uracil-DNA glycosylase
MSTQTIDLQEIQKKLVDKLRPSGWADKLKGFVMTDDFRKIIEYLYEQRSQNKRFTPPLKTMFSAFENCPYNQLKAVIIGAEPYQQLGVADGMAFSSSLATQPNPVTECILQSVYKTTYTADSLPPEHNPDFTRWAIQGLLLLNTALTVEIDKQLTHQKIWRPFISYLLDILNSLNTGLVFVFIGKKAQELEDLISEEVHYKLFISHPAAAIGTGQQWDCNDVWNKINKIIYDTNKEHITW